MARRQRDHLGEYTSAALPLIWAQKLRRELSNADMARELDVDDAMVAKLLYGDRRAGRDLAVKCRDLYAIRIEAWGEAMPNGWLPPEVPPARDSETALVADDAVHSQTG